MRHLKSAAGLLGGLFVSLGLLLGLVWLAGTNGWFLTRMMTWSAPAASTGLPEAEYAAVGHMTADYLGERQETFQHLFTRNGNTYQCFNRTEQQHLYDCRHLFHLCWQTALLLLCTGLALSLIAQRPRMTGAGVLLAMGLGLVLTIWGLVDFDGLFVRFHQLAFTNTLWVLDPATNLLIRLMPTVFFTRCAGIIGGIWLLLCLAAAVLLIRSREERATE